MTKLTAFRQTALILGVASLFLITACETSQPITGSDSETESLLPTMNARGGNGGGNAGETSYACDAEGSFVGYNETNNPDYGIYSYTLWAGKHNDAGTVTITNDDDNLYVTYNTNETADLSEIHVYVWTNEADIPSKRPAPGQAPYVVENIFDDAYTLTIPVAELGCGDSYYVSTHAALIANATDNDEAAEGDNAGETAYAGDSNSPACYDGQKGAWWGYVTYTVDCFFDVSGTVYEDFDHSYDNEEENPFAGICVELFDADGNSLGTVETDENGGYLFEHIPAGNGYSVSTCSAPEGDYLATENGDGYSFDLTEDKTDVDFGFGPLFDVTVNITLPEVCEGGSITDMYLTDGDGAIVDGFENLVPGIYTLYIVTVGYEEGNVEQGIVLTEDTTVSFTFTCVVTPGPNDDDDDEDNNNDGDDDGTVGGGTETAYLFGNWSFCDVQPRWGWANYILPGQVIQETIWAGAGQCDTDNATAVGEAMLAYDPYGGLLHVTITYYAGYEMNNLHVNIGEPSDISPNMNANGNFNNNPEGVSYPINTFSETYSVSGAGEYVIVHMEAAGF